MTRLERIADCGGGEYLEYTMEKCKKVKAVSFRNVKLLMQLFLKDSFVLKNLEACDCNTNSSIVKSLSTLQNLIPVHTKILLMCIGKQNDCL